VNWKRTSQLVVIITTIVIIGYDICAAIWGGRHETVSGVIWDWSAKAPVLPFAAGVLMGHLFWSNTEK
jgi:hypothetical protein